MYNANGIVTIATLGVIVVAIVIGLFALLYKYNKIRG